MRAAVKPVEKERVDADGDSPVVAYAPRYVNIVRQAAERGATYAEIFRLLGVSSSVVLLWRMCYPEFDLVFTEAEKISEKIRDEREALRTLRVEEALYQRAVGYEFMSEKIVVVDHEIKRVQTVEHIPPDKGAAEMWLQARDPDRWKPARTLVDARITVARIDEHTPPAEAVERFRAMLEGGAVIEGEIVSGEDTE